MPEAALELLLERAWYLPTRSIGRLFMGQAYECFTAEDRIRTGKKIAAETAIPTGRWRVVATWSPKFKKVLPEIIVPGWSGLRFHGGHDEKDTAGCVLCGYSKDPEGIYESAPAAKAVNATIMAAFKAKREVWITVVNANPEAAQTVTG